LNTHCYEVTSNSYIWYTMSDIANDVLPGVLTTAFHALICYYYYYYYYII